MRSVCSSNYVRSFSLLISMKRGYRVRALVKDVEWFVNIFTPHSSHEGTRYQIIVLSIPIRRVVAIELH